MKIFIVTSSTKGHGTQTKVFVKHDAAEEHKQTRDWCDYVTITEHEVELPPCPKCKEHADRWGKASDDFQQAIAADENANGPLEDKPLCDVECGPEPRGRCVWERTHRCRPFEFSAEKRKEALEKAHQASAEALDRTLPPVGDPPPMPKVKPPKEDEPTPCPECETKDKEIERLRGVLYTIRKTAAHYFEGHPPMTLAHNALSSVRHIAAEALHNE